MKIEVSLTKDQIDEAIKKYVGERINAGYYSVLEIGEVEMYNCGDFLKIDKAVAYATVEEKER